MKYLFCNVLGCFVLNEKLEIVETVAFSNIKEFESKEIAKQLMQKHNAQELPKEHYTKVLLQFKDKQYFTQFYAANNIITRKRVRESVSSDLFIIQTISNINELDKVTNILSKRLREWCGLYVPEAATKIHDHKKFAELIVSKTREELLEEGGIDLDKTMGADLQEQDIIPIRNLAHQILDQFSLREKHEEYLKSIMKVYCPNILELAGATIGAKLLELGKGLKRLAMFPASTIQLLGAEKALFRHIKTGSKSPKYGVIINHPVIQKAPRSDKGKASRQLADKLSLCARLDYFKGEFKAPEYKKELEEKFIHGKN